MRGVIAWATVATAALAVGGCGLLPRDPVAAPPLFTNPNTDSGWEALISGTLEERDGCLWVGEHPALMPWGTTWDADGHAATLPDGTIAPVGSTLSGSGGYVDGLDAVERGFGAEVRAGIAGCAAADTEVAVFNGSGEIEVG